MATRNRGKLHEFRDLLAPLGVRLVDLDEAGISPHPDEDSIENADTFEENARAKAHYFARLGGGRPVVADDSGLCVHALGGAPGVRSRRYAGVTGSETVVSTANKQLLLRSMAGVDDRRAEFACAISYVDGATEILSVGRASGRILLSPAGSGGFGYDPLFWSDDLGRSFGEASEQAKAQVSHRARAVETLLTRLRTPTP